MEQSSLSGTSLSDTRLWTRLLLRALRTLSDATSIDLERVTSSSKHWELQMDKQTMDRIIAHGVVEQLKQKPQQNQQVPREKFIADLVRTLATAEFSEDELIAMYRAVANRARSRTCCVCGRAAVAFEGDYVWTDGDMSKPKLFRCFYCKERSL